MKVQPHLIKILNMKIVNIILLAISMATCSTLFAQENITVDSLFNQGRIDYNNGRYEEAITDFTLLLNLEASHKNALLQRGFCFSLIKDYKSAIADFSKVLLIDPSHQFAYVSRGSAKNKLEEYQSALDDFNKALELKPEDAEAFNNRGFAKKGLGDFKGACEDWNRSKKMGNDEAKIILKNNYCK